jgi:type II secretory pathway pseudopilin PulG
MKAQSYKIIFEGEVAEGVDPDTAKGNLQRLFKTDDATAERLFSGKRVVLKKNLTAGMLKKYDAALTGAGVRYSTDPEISSTPEASAPRAEAGAAANVGLTLQPIPRARKNPPGEDAVNPYAPPTQDPVVSKQVFCRSCGNKINETDTVCPKCGDKQIVGKPKSKVVAGLLAIFLGFFGAHRFYLGQWVGLIYLFLGLLAWPVALVEGIVFLLTPKDRWERKYGNVVSSGSGALIAVAVLVFIAVLGILAAIAVPAYVDYTNRVKVAQAVASAQPSIKKIEAFALQKGYFPGNNLEAGLPADLSADHVESMVVSENGVLTMTFGGKEAGPIDEQTLLFIPSLQGNSVQWDCSGGSLPARFRAKDCHDGKYSGQQTVTTSQWVTAEDGVSKIRVPKNWNRLPELNEAASLKYGNPRLEQYLIVFSEPRADFGSDMDLYTYNDTIMEKYFLAGIRNINIKLLGEINLNGMQGVKYEIRGEIDNIKIVYLYTAFASRNHFHQVLFWTLPTKWSDSQGIYESALSTFTEN